VINLGVFKKILSIFMLPKFAAFFMLLSLLFLEIGYIKDSNSMQTLKLEYDFLRC